ncbi:hypothetical protein LWI29_015172 [Acer saccharum]|uniref:Uncharacterized protein n=1 Tax=Acer saccharum TaxID=4024 RepID=A0AA39SJQ9_ACESA|nr:hypothetical protein LWI29_015172 [Acer saccharum]
MSFIVPIVVDFKRGVFWNGAFVRFNSVFSSLYFKVDAKEKVQKMPTPLRNDGRQRLYMYLNESRDHLHHVGVYGTSKFDIYKMRIDFSRWFMKYHVYLDSIILAFPKMIDPSDQSCRFALHDIIREEDDAKSYMVFHILGKVDAKEKVQKMPTPLRNDGRQRLYMYLNESRDHLHHVGVYGTSKFDIYKMRIDFSRWFMKYHVDLDSIILAFPKMIDPSDQSCRFALHDIIREEDDAKSYMVFHILGKVIQCNLNDLTFNMICNFSRCRDFKCGWSDSYHYIKKSC